MNQPQSLSESHPGGCFLGFNAAIDRKASEQLVYTFNDAMRNGYEEINLLLSSSGGILDFAYYACSILDALPIKIISYNIGNVCSAANLLFLCGDERFANEGSTFFFHQTHYPPPSDNVTASFAKARSKAIARDDKRSASYVAQKTRSPVKTVMNWQRSELFMDTSTALENGVIHGIKAPAIPPNAFFHQIVI